MIKFTKAVLREELRRRRVKVPTLSEVTGIPRDRIYAWYRDNTNPKKEDQQILENWLNEVPFKKSEEIAQKAEDKDKTIYNLSEAQIIQARAILILAGKINSGGPGGAFLDDEDEPKGPSQEDLRPPSGNTKDKGKRRGT